MGPGQEFGGARAAEEGRQARVDAALQAGWVIRRDPLRLEYTAAREMLTARTLDGLLDAIDAADGS
jgi:hypothetical protein